MADTWIRFESKLKYHRNLRKLARKLNVRPAEAAGLLGCFWTWAQDFAGKDGYIQDLDDVDVIDVIEEASLWEGEKSAFVHALLEIGFIEADHRVHRWDEYEGKLYRDREAHAKRQKTYREKQNQSSSREPSRDPSCDASRDPLRQDSDKNETKTDQTKEKKTTDPQPPPLPTTGSAQLPDAADRAKKGGGEGENDQTDPNKPIDPDRVVALLGSAGVELTLQNEQCAQQLARQYGMEWFEKALCEAIGKHANHPLRYAEKVLQNWANGDGTPTAAREQIKRSRRVSRSYDQRTYTREQDEAIFTDPFEMEI